MKQIRREVTLTPGPIIVRGNMSSRNTKRKKFADYVLSWEPRVPIAIVEAKDNNHTPSQGMQQALGYAEILEVFNVSKIGRVAGCLITDGKVERGIGVRLLRDDVVIHEGMLSTLKRFKDEVSEVTSGQECGMAFENYQDMRKGDVIECFRVE